MSAESNAALVGGLFATFTLAYQAFTTNKTKRRHNYSLRKLFLSIRRADWSALPRLSAQSMANFLAGNYNITDGASVFSNFVPALRTSALIAALYVVGLFIIANGTTLDRLSSNIPALQVDILHSLVSIMIMIALIYMIKRMITENPMTDFPELTSTGRWKSILYWPLAYFVAFYLFAAGIRLSPKLGQLATLVLIELLLFSTLFPFVLSFRYRSLRDIFLPRLLFIGASILYCMFAFRLMDFGATHPELSSVLFLIVWTAFIIPAASASDRVHRYSFYAILIAVAVVSFLPISGQYNIYNFTMPVIFLAALWLLAALNSLFDAASVLFSYRLLRISATTQKFSKPFWRSALTTGASITLIYLASSVCFAALIAGFFWLLERSTYFPTLTNLPRSTTFFAATHTAWIPTFQIASIPPDIAHFLKAVKYMALSVCVPLLLTLIICVALIAAKASGALIFPTALKLHKLLIDEKTNEHKFYTNYLRTSAIIGATASAVAYLAIKLYDA